MASDPWVGEMMMFAGNFAPVGWFTCDGQLLNIADYSTLFNLIGTTYGGDGVNTFAVPNLSGRVPMHMGTNSFGSTYVIGQTGGVQTVTLTTLQIPSHTHTIVADSSGGTATSPSNAYFASSAPTVVYSTATPTRAMNPAMLQSAGGSQPHENMQPYLAITYCISAFGVYPTT